ncbi:serine protease [Rubellimicrobium sp. CFH 75288]|uniref:trypsin-like serine peptidase n=1 Tax=Rubellimicrobium sp. CFH 75288 TaxID=2697034 RepID=UPI00141361B5|nr:trypsin-like peptidase domain-containing protein [Rubellimicrobium sp. CFH 75288]NAZ36771.1 trypsin-like serine protease [Rubellimicrobium sp. CFH 75288]
MRRAAVIGCVLAAWLAGCGAAGAGPLHALSTGAEATAWSGVGRLDIDGKGFCTGALIAPDRVLTAAHCLFDRATGAPVEPGRIRFLAGFRHGRSAAERAVRRAVVHPAYRYNPLAGAAESRFDLALLELDRPIPPGDVRPFETAETLRPGDPVSVISYAAGRADAPALEDRCAVLGEEAGVLVMTCDVDFGASGSPVFQIEGDVARIVSVVSAKGELGPRQVSLGTTVGGPLAELQATLVNQEPALAGRVGALPGIRHISAGERTDTGARWVSAPRH